MGAFADKQDLSRLAALSFANGRWLPDLRGMMIAHRFALCSPVGGPYTHPGINLTITFQSRFTSTVAVLFVLNGCCCLCRFFEAGHRRSNICAIMGMDRHGANS